MKIFLLSFYTFPKSKGTVDLTGIWETIGVENFNTSSPTWVLIRRFSSSNDAPVERVEKLPQFIIERFGFKVDRKAIFGS